MVSYCPICGKPVYFVTEPYPGDPWSCSVCACKGKREQESERDCEKKRSLGRDYHPLCLKCQQCKRQLTAGQHAEHDEKPYCTMCYMRRFGPKGSRPIFRHSMTSLH